MYAGEAGFADELALLFPQGKYHIGISRWDVKEDEGPPEVRAYEALTRPSTRSPLTTRALV
jgi:hypothetical protein